MLRMKNLTELTIELGGYYLQVLIEKRRTKHIPDDMIRQILIGLIKRWIISQEPTELGRVCALGKNFDPGPDYRNASLVTTGTNAWSAVHISSSDSGLMLLQKIATTAILVEAIRITNEGQPDLDKSYEESWIPIQIFTGEEIDRLEQDKSLISKHLGW